MKTARAHMFFGSAAVAAGIFLAVFAIAIAVRDWLAPSSTSWSVWSNAAVVLAGIGAVTLSLAGSILRRSAQRIHRRTVDSFLPAEERDRVFAAIRGFENRTSGEIRVHIDERAPVAATRIFERLGMTKTRERNGVLFCVSVRSRTLAVVGDKGIHTVVPDGFWQDIVAAVEARFADGDFVGGLVDGIAMAGAALAEHFPPRGDDRNELSDEITERR